MSNPKLYAFKCGMTAPEFSANHTHEFECYGQASVGERLGWQECEEPYCGSFDRQESHAVGEYVAYECGNCVDGFTPPAELVERACDRAVIDPDQAVTVLLEQARWIGEQAL